jgi:phosphoglycerate dehydrogenase-like enzyme
MENCQVWIRLKLPENEIHSLTNAFSNVRFVVGDDGEGKAAQSDAVFTEEAVPEDLVARMSKLRWIHVTRGGVNIYLTPAVMSRSIQVTGSKGIHGCSFSEFALAYIFALAKKLPQCLEA